MDWHLLVPRVFFCLVGFNACGLPGLNCSPPPTTSRVSWNRSVLRRSSSSSSDAQFCIFLSEDDDDYLPPHKKTKSSEPVNDAANTGRRKTREFNFGKFDECSVCLVVELLTFIGVAPSARLGLSILQGFSSSLIWGRGTCKPTAISIFGRYPGTL